MNPLGQTTCPGWCDVPAGHDGEHDGEADFPRITATADRRDFHAADDGVTVPEVIVRLVQHDDPSNTVPQHRLQLSVIRPDDQHAACALTIDEAALLRKHLTALLREARQEVAW